MPTIGLDDQGYAIDLGSGGTAEDILVDADAAGLPESVTDVQALAEYVGELEGGGGGSTTRFLQLRPRQALLPASNFAQLVTIAGTNFPVEALAFDGGSTDEDCYFSFALPDYASGNLTLRIRWYSDSASSGNVVWGARLACITPDTDSQDIETKAFATAQTVQDTHLGTTGQRLHLASLTVSNLDSLAAGDQCFLHVYRDASDTTNDTMTGDALLVQIDIEYTGS